MTYHQEYYRKNKEKINEYSRLYMKCYRAGKNWREQNNSWRTILDNIGEDKCPPLTPKQKHTRTKIIKELSLQGEFAIVKRLLAMAMLLLVFTSCKTNERVVTRDRFVSDTLITHTTRSVLLPVKNITKIDRPCLNDSLKPLNQTIATPYAQVTLKDENGSLVVEVNTDSIVNERVKSELKRIQSDTTIDKQIITKYRLPPWMWYVLGYTVLITLYTFRRFIPYLNMIP